MSRQIGIVVADRYPFMRRGIKNVIIEQGDMKWLGEATSVRKASRICQSLEPDVLLLAPNLADYDPAESVLSIQSACPTVKILILSSCDQQRSVRAALNAGATGYVLKSDAIEPVVQAIRTVAEGTRWISPSLLLSEQQAKEKPGLSKRQKNVLGLLITGKTDRQISEILYIGERTVRYQLRQIYNKFGVNTRIEAVAQAFRLELV